MPNGVTLSFRFKELITLQDQIIPNNCIELDCSYNKITELPKIYLIL